MSALKSQTQTKAIAGALSGVLVAFIPVIMANLSGSDLLPEQLLALNNALNALMMLISGGIVGWVSVYFAPRNVPK
ncbi:MAG: hypothetical protein ACR2QF_15980 [Geminicoccaceae bacterium]